MSSIENFNPNDVGDLDANIYGLPFNDDTASLVIIPVPWEVTVSYKAGTAKGPQAVFDASFQVDLYDPLVADAWKLGLAMSPIDEQLVKKNNDLRAKAAKYIAWYAEGEKLEANKDMQLVLNELNSECTNMVAWVKKQALSLLNKQKTVGLLGGDHSTPLGLMQALAEVHSDFGILQIDAHADLRVAYEGFTYSHASIMYNALKISQVKKLVQVGIRDFCDDEQRLIAKDERISTFFDHTLKSEQYVGVSWHEQCLKIVKNLPDKVYLSIDIDGLDPKLCPSTGTPVPGGLEFEQLIYLVHQVQLSGRKIIGFDLNEVAPGPTEWDANVGARVLYRISNLCMQSLK